MATSDPRPEIRHFRKLTRHVKEARQTLYETVCDRLVAYADIGPSEISVTCPECQKWMRQRGARRRLTELRHQVSLLQREIAELEEELRS